MKDISTRIFLITAGCMAIFAILLWLGLDESRLILCFTGINTVLIMLALYKG